MTNIAASREGERPRKDSNEKSQLATWRGQIKGLSALLSRSRPRSTRIGLNRPESALEFDEISQHHVQLAREYGIYIAFM